MDRWGYCQVVLGTSVGVGDHSWRCRLSSNWSWSNGRALDNNSPAGMGGYELCDLEQMT